MIKFSDIVELASLLINSANIKVGGLTIQYELDSLSHKKLEEELYYRSKSTDPLIHRSIFDASIGGINFRFIEKKD